METTPLPMSHRHLRPLSVIQRPKIAIPALSLLLGLPFMLALGSPALWVRQGDSQEERSNFSSPILWMRKLSPREVRSFTRGDIAHVGQSWGSKWGSGSSPELI